MATITFNSVPNNAAASQTFVEVENVNRGGGSPLIQHRVLVIGQYNSGKSPTDNEPQLILNKEDAWDRYGRGSLLAAQIERVFASGGGVQVYALPVADDGDATAASGSFAISGTATADGTLALYVAGRRVEVAVTDGDAATAVGDAIEAAINADLDLPVTASNSTGTVTLTARWAGEAGNQIDLDSNRRDDDAVPAGLTLSTTAMSSGATNPAIDTALGNLGDTWYTEIVCPYLDTTSIGALESAGDTRYAPGVKRFFAGFVGYTDTNGNLQTALGSRNSQWTTMVPVHGSPTPAYEIAASAAGVVAATQQSNPGRPAKNQILPGVVADDDNDLTYSTRDTTVKAGGSWTKNLPGGRVSIGDLVTTRTTAESGADTDDWRWTVTIGALQFMAYAAETTFTGSPFDQAVVIGDDNPPGPTYAIRPRTVVAYAISLVDDWTSRGLIADRDATVEGITANINSGNSGRIDLLLPVVIAEGLRVMAVKLEFAPVTG
jgi:phage tail sheath gpL-like